MYTTKSLVFFLVLFLVAAVVEARPISSSHRRRACQRRATTNKGPSTADKPKAVQAAVKPAEDSPAPATPKAATDKPSTDKPSTKTPAKDTPDSSDDGDDTSTKVSSAAAGKTTSPALKSAKSSMNALFPVDSFSKAWSTAPGSENALSLVESTFRPKNVLSALPITFESAPDGKKGLKAHYPKGSYTFTHKPLGGLSFYAPGPANVDLTTAKEATFGYSVFFEKGFGWQLGGKLPGLYGGNSEEGSISCSGGSRNDACFSARLMWRADGAGEFYTYLPPSFAENKKVCDIPPESDCNPTYGASIGRGAFSFKDGQWNTVSERVRLNDVGKANGEIELFIEGKSVIKATGLVLRNSAAGRIRGIQMQTFFGGSKPQFASPKDQDVWFSDFSTAITETL